MKKFKLTKVIASSLMVASVLALNPIAASAEWKQNNTGWWYEDESSFATGWKLLDGNWYYFNSDGYMEHDTVVDGCQLGSNGVWIQEIVIATVGDEKITKDDLNKEMNRYDAQLKKQYGNDYATNNNIKDQITKIKQQQLDKLVTEKILLKKATELNIKPSDDVINKQINDTISQYKTQYSGEGQFESILQQSGTTENELRDLIKKSIITKVVEENMLKDISVKDEEVETYYNENKDTIFTIGAGANVAHILVADEETAKSLKAKLDAGADFSTLAKENSLDPGTKANGGNLGFVQYNSTDLVPEFVNGFKNLKEGEVSTPVKSQYGYHLIKATGLKSAELISFDKVKDKIKAALLEEKQGNTFNSKITEWKVTLNVKVYEDKL
jgi:foldase protein PrsA